MWSQIVIKVLPIGGFSESDIERLSTQFATDSCLLNACARLVFKEPQPAVGGGKALATWIVNQISAMKSFLADESWQQQVASDTLAAVNLASEEAIF